jgi:hypothetical protein
LASFTHDKSNRIIIRDREIEDWKNQREPFEKNGFNNGLQVDIIGSEKVDKIKR